MAREFPSAARRSIFRAAVVPLFGPIANPQDFHHMRNRFSRTDRYLLPMDRTLAKLPRVQLVIQRGEAQETVRNLPPPVYTIGGSSGCDLALGDGQFPNWHSYIYVREDAVQFRHLGAAPLVTVNGRICRSGELLDRDRIRMGPYQFQVRIAVGDERQTASNDTDCLAFPRVVTQLDADICGPERDDRNQYRRRSI